MNSKIKLSFIFLVIFIYFLYCSFYPKQIIKLSFKQKFIQFECFENELCGGWADRLKGLLSAYAFSLITGRSFTIKMTKNCDLKNILEPNEVNWNYEQIPQNMTMADVNIGWDFGYFDKFKNDISDFTKLDNISLIKVRSGIMFGNALRENPNLKKQIEELGYDQSKFHIAYMIRIWYKKLFKLNKNLQEKYDLYLKRLRPTQDTKVICTQVRKGDPNQLEDRDKLSQNDYWNFINNTFLNSTENKYTIFLTTDSEYIKDEAKSFFSNNQVIFQENSSIHIDTKLSKESECKQMEMVLLDFHLLQNCDIGVISHSGFGILGLWNRPDPFKDLYVYTKPFDKSKLNFFNKDSYFSDWKNLSFVKYSTLGDIFFPP